MTLDTRWSAKLGLLRELEDHGDTWWGFGDDHEPIGVAAPRRTMNTTDVVVVRWVPPTTGPGFTPSMCPPCNWGRPC